jgi:hypothetical protein
MQQMESHFVTTITMKCLNDNRINRCVNTRVHAGNSAPSVTFEQWDHMHTGNTTTLHSMVANAEKFPHYPPISASIWSTAFQKHQLTWQDLKRFNKAMGPKGSYTNF